jgi:small-conductance mechanosensitive channel
MTVDDIIDQLGPRFAKWSLLHEALGTASTKQQEDFDRLHRDILSLTDNHIDTLKNECDAVQQQCQQSYKAILNMKRLMGEYIDDSPLDSEARPYSLTLDKLNAEKDIVQKVKDMRPCKRQIETDWFWL